MVASGDGTKKTTRPLAGEKSPTQLFALLKRTMPDNDPGSLTDDQYKAVADYIHGAFYSPDAQARLHPPRITFSHLTVGQYRNAVADLIGGFRPGAPTDTRQGLHGEYFNSRDIGNSRMIDRVDPEIRFEFGMGAPQAGPSAESDGSTINPDHFCIRWQGSVFAEETGDYEFVVRTEHALRLFVNDQKKPVVDAIVKSGDDVEYRATTFLIAGRSYPVRLEFFKGRQGDGKKKKPVKPSNASVQFLWRPPHQQADELIPSRCMSPASTPEVAVIQTPFPPDDRSYGWERGTAVSKEWLSATADAALETAGYVSAHAAELAGVTDDPAKQREKLHQFCRSFAERAFRRPLAPEEVQHLVDRQFDRAPDVDAAVKYTIIRVMLSPDFLYPEASQLGRPAADDYAVACRLALLLWDSQPDAALMAAAAAGKLSTHDQIGDQAQRMLKDPRAKLKIRKSLLAWLRVDQPAELVKDAKKFPDFDPAVASDMRACPWSFSWTMSSGATHRIFANYFFPRTCSSMAGSRSFMARTCRKTPDSERQDLRRARRRRSDAPLHALEFCLSGREFSHPSRRLHHPRYPWRDAAAASQCRVLALPR